MKKTTDLLNELTSSTNIDKYIKNNTDSIINQNLSEHLCQIFDERQISKTKVVRNSNLNEVYAYQIMSGKRMPSRDKIICLCIGAEFSIEDINQTLRIAGYSPLYPKIVRDSIIIYCIQKEYTVWQINEELYKRNEETL